MQKTEFENVQFITNEEIRKKLNEIFQNVNENYKLSANSGSSEHVFR